MSHLVHSIGHVKINTSVADAVVKEATEILGLRVSHSDGQQTWLSSNGRARRIGATAIKRKRNAHNRAGSANGRRRSRGRIASRESRLSYSVRRPQHAMHGSGRNLCDTRGAPF